MKPHKCPICEGSDKTYDIWNYSSTACNIVTCPACWGMGVIWEYDLAEVGIGIGNYT